MILNYQLLIVNYKLKPLELLRALMALVVFRSSKRYANKIKLTAITAIPATKP